MYESVSDFNNDEPGRLLFAAVSYMYMHTCTSACNTIRERGEGGGEGASLNDIHNITAFIRHSTDPMAIETEAIKLSTKILQNC